VTIMNVELRGLELTVAQFGWFVKLKASARN